MIRNNGIRLSFVFDTAETYTPQLIQRFPLAFVVICHNVNRMSKSIRISDDLASIAEAASVVAHRSPPQQIEHWAQIGRVMEAALSYPAQDAVKRANRSDLDTALALVNTKEGQRRAQSVIRRTTGKIESTD